MYCTGCKIRDCIISNEHFYKTQKDIKMHNMVGSPVTGELETVTISGTGKFVAHMI
jgi:hypothetical protein